ncbi:cardiolipin synthase [candidate division KSB1 bacterium]|nr:cardiolipin synthase [candidate division KSB1 bacterium]
MGLVTLIVTVFEGLGIISALVALFYPRTSQGAIAWIIALLAIPYIAVPLFWIFGRTKFHGYVSARQKGDSKLAHIAERLRQNDENFDNFPAYFQSRLLALKKLAKLPYTHGNELQLLVDGHNTFDSIFAGFAAARHYILVQFFIVHDDQIGREFKHRLVQMAREGIRIYFLYDEIGCRMLPLAYWQEMRSAGIHVSSFHSTRGIWNRFQINFRNHRKIVIVDGHTAWIGGHNVGDEYLGRSKRFGHWRDTHIRIKGPAALGVQLSFVEDWHWATNEQLLNLCWQPEKEKKNGHTVLIIPSGPADEFETASLMVQQAIQEATERFWIASAYFVPDEGVMQALRLAALRGVDVRILIPDTIDHYLPYFSVFSIAGDMIKAGIHIYRYKKGFLHEKVFVVDNAAAAVGTANLDNRSFRLNFEITAICLGDKFVAQVAAMLEKDFAFARKMTLRQVNQRPLWFKLLSRAAYLAAPVQ